MTVLEQKNYEPLPVGQYPARISEAVVEPSKFGGDQVRVTFAVTAPGYEGRDIRGFCSATFSKASKLYAWTRAAFGGRDIPADYDLDTSHLVGKPVELVLVQRASDDGRVFNRIDAVLPKGGRVAAPAAPPPAPGNGGGQVLHQGGTRTTSSEPPEWPARDDDLAEPPAGDDDGFPF